MRLLRQRAFAPRKSGDVTPPVGLVERASISGSQILDGNGQPLQLRGMNWGSWGKSQPGDAVDDVTQGANVVRLPLRWWGEYGTADVDSRDDLAVGTARIKPANLARLDSDIAQLSAAGLWILLFIDSNCGQSGLQTGSEAFCGSVGPYAANGRNFWTDLSQRALFVDVWKFMAARYQNVPRLLAYEILPEPLDSRPPEWADDVRDFYREMIAAIRTVDTRTPFLIGPRDGYKIDNAAEALLPERNDCIYTGNMLNPVVTGTDDLPLRVGVLTGFRAASNVPILVQQLGRSSINDLDLRRIRASMSICNANRIHYTYWNKRDNGASPDNYGQYYPDGSGGWIRKQNEWDLVAQYYAQSFTALRDAAHAAATAAGALLFYVLPDFSNVTQDSAGTTPVTALGQPVGRITPVVGTGFQLQQATTTARPLLAAAPNGVGWIPDGVDDHLQLSGNFFASGDDTTVIASGFVGQSNTIRVLFHAGTSATVVRYPYVAISAADLPEASWRGDDNVLTGVAGTSTMDNKPCVIVAAKQGSNKRLLVFGAQEGTTDTAAVGSIATFTRARDGSSTTNSSYYVGRRDFLCLGKTMTDPQIDAIARFAAYLSGSHYFA
jgi:Cellulase (glycosyl hydrolase family 5)